MLKIDDEFVKGASDNLPVVDSDMVNSFYISNINFLIAEVRNVKTKRSAKESYGDNAVAYVQLKRTKPLCTVKARITPEHKIHKKSYNVCAIINEDGGEVLSSECLDCAASLGCCKHGVAFLLWLHRRSEEPSTTEVKCFWKASNLSKVCRSDMAITSFTSKKPPTLGPKSSQFLEEVLSTCSEADGSVFRLFKKPKFECVSIHQTMMSYKKYDGGNNKCAEDFIEYAKSILTEDLCSDVEKKTRNQSESLDWYEVRYGRITASVVHEAACCKVLSGSLTEKIMGASPPLESEAISRGKSLEPLVLKEVGRIKQICIRKAGIYLKKEYPIFGASPDGIADEFALEVKCPSKEKNIPHYIKKDIIQKKNYYQLQLQMFFSHKKKGLFCVASPDFEQSRKVQIVEVQLDEEKIVELLGRAEMFWKNAIYPILTS